MRRTRATNETDAELAGDMHAAECVGVGLMPANRQEIGSDAPARRCVGPVHAVGAGLTRETCPQSIIVENLCLRACGTLERRAFTPLSRNCAYRDTGPTVATGRWACLQSSVWGLSLRACLTFRKGVLA